MNIYGQYSANKTLSLCKNLHNLEDVPKLIQEMTGRFSYSVSEVSEEEGYPSYTKENINKANEERAKLMPLSLHSKEDIAGNKKLMKGSVKLIKKYLGYQEENISNYEKFCLELFLAGLNSHLNKNEKVIEHYQNALKLLNNALKHEEKGWGDLSLKRKSGAEGLEFEDFRVEVMKNSIEKKLAKHKIMSRGPLRNIENQDTVTSKEALLSRSFLSSTEIAVEKINASFDKMRSTKFSRQVLEANASNALEHERFKLVIIKGQLEGVGDSTAGYTNARNTIVIGDQDQIGTVLFHELTHKAMNDVFHNSFCIPYAKGDIQAMEAYRESMRQVFLNYVDALLPIDELAKLECNTNYYTDLRDPHKPDDETHSSKQKVKFAHPWSRDMTLDQIAENCYSKNGLFTNNDAIRYFAEGGRIVSNGQTLCEGYKTREGMPNIDYVCALGDQLQLLFAGPQESGDTYDISQLDTEFITNLTDTMFDRSAEDLVIIQPLMDYIEKYVSPALDDYIANHPSRNRINDTLKENDAQYSRQLANAESLLLAPKESQSPRSLILGTLMIGLAYTSWSLINGLLIS